MSEVALDILEYMKASSDVSSPDEAWAQFDSLSRQLNILNWHYVFLPPFETQLEDIESSRLRLSHTPKLAQDQNSNDVKKRLRSMESSTLFENYEEASWLNPLLQQISPKTETSNILLFPVFGPRAYNGCFILLLGEHTQMADVKSSFSVACQMTHIAHVQHMLNHANDDNKLTSREQDVLRGLSKGLSNNDIARELNISPFTVNGYLQRVFLKTGAQDRTSAVLFGFSRGLIR